MLDDAKAAEAEPNVRPKLKIRTKEDPTGEGIIAAPESMDTTAAKPTIEGFSSKTLHNKNGTFPAWVAKRKIKKMTGKAKKKVKTSKPKF